MHTRNIFNQAGQRVDFTLKRQEYVTLNFVTNTKPIVLAYQIMDWWSPNNESQNKKNFDKLSEISWGTEYHKGTITIEVYGVLRQRLLQQGQTSYFTYDFETSQNLFLSTGDRTVNNYAYGMPKAKKRKPFDDTRFDYEVYGDTDDHMSREEIPQRQQKVITINFKKPLHNYCYLPTNTDSWIEKKTGTDGYTRCTALVIPGPTGFGPQNEGANNATSARGNIEIEINDNTEETEKEAYHISHATVIDRASYPIKLLHPPKITDETGEMKWIYECRISTELDVTFHLKPDHNPLPTQYALYRQTLEHPVVTLKRYEDTNFVRCSCVPYEVPI